jgi:phage tail-like protein
MTTTTLDPGTTVFFRLTVDGQDMGLFNECDGLGIQVETETYSEGGNNGYDHQLPTRLKYPNLRLTRPLTPDSAKVITWINSILTGIQRPTIEVAALRANGSLVVRWSLYDALPVNWTGPTFDPNRSEVATEVLEIAYQGFDSSGE